MLHLFDFNEAHLKFPLLKFMEFLPIREYKTDENTNNGSDQRLEKTRAK